MYTDDLPFVDQPAYRASTSSAIFGLLMEPRYEHVWASLCEYTAGPIFLDRTAHQAAISVAGSRVTDGALLFATLDPFCEFVNGHIVMNRRTHQAAISSAMSGLLMGPCSVLFTHSNLMVSVVEFDF